MRSVVVIALMALACATSRVPSSLRGYDVVVEGSDEQSRELARAMQAYGFNVRRTLRGGSRPTAVLVHFTFSDPGAMGSQRTWLHIRLADTRSGAIVGVGAVQLDSTTATPRARASAVVQTLAAP